MPKLIKCELMKKENEPFSNCLNPRCNEKLVFDATKDVYYQCPVCDAVMYNDKLVPCEIAEEMFPGAIKIAY